MVDRMLGFATLCVACWGVSGVAVPGDARGQDGSALQPTRTFAAVIGEDSSYWSTLRCPPPDDIEVVVYYNYDPDGGRYVWTSLPDPRCDVVDRMAAVDGVIAATGPYSGGYGFTPDVLVGPLAIDDGDGLGPPHDLTNELVFEDICYAVAGPASDSGDIPLAGEGNECCAPSDPSYPDACTDGRDPPGPLPPCDTRVCLYQCTDC